MTREITIIGFGKMGSAIGEAAVNNGWSVNAIDPIKPEKLPAGVQYASQYSASSKCPILMAVKPGIMSKALQSLEHPPLIISIAAGVTTETLRQYTRGKIIRAMPNTPARIGHGVTALYFPPETSNEDRTFCLELFKVVGSVVEVSDEDHMHTVTALSGSGPAYVELFAQALEDAGVTRGLTRKTARELSLGMLRGTSEYMIQQQISPQEMIHEVTSPGGTTAAALQALKKYNFEATIDSAIEAAYKRSMELNKNN